MQASAFICLEEYSELGWKIKKQKKQTSTIQATMCPCMKSAIHYQNLFGRKKTCQEPILQ